MRGAREAVAQEIERRDRIAAAEKAARAALSAGPQAPYPQDLSYWRRVAAGLGVAR